MKKHALKLGESESMRRADSEEVEGVL